MIDLKPCPFCGGKAISEVVPGGFGTYSNFARCGCAKCKIYAQNRFTAEWDFHNEREKAEALSIEQWNTRK
jgi:Lar family restriction alleviation protein